jgi:monofunctional biosynthetic peptidoglycan transglycosylase
MPDEAQRAPQPTPRRFRRWLSRLLVALMVVVLGYHAWLFAQVWWLRGHNPSTTAFMEQGLDRLQEKNAKARLQHRWVPYEQVSTHLKRAVIAAEDQKFLDHGGFDIEEMEKAYELNQKRGRVRRGASTISQQLAKNLFLSPRRSYLRKVQEAVITGMIELLLSKRRILEIYLNVIEWGNGVYGAEAAARHYFGTSAAALDAVQSARLAAMIPNPRFYDRRGVTPYLEQRTEILLGQMDYVRVP